MAMRKSTLIKHLGQKFNLNAVPSEEFDGCDAGIWIRDDICKEETDWYDYAEGTLDDNKLNRFLKKNGWFAEPYDSCTIMMYPI